MPGGRGEEDLLMGSLPLVAIARKDEGMMETISRLLMYSEANDNVQGAALAIAILYYCCFNYCPPGERFHLRPCYLVASTGLGLFHDSVIASLASKL